MKHVNELYDFKNESHYLIQERFTERRKLVNISQKELAKEIDVDPSTLTNWIAGTSRANKTGISAKKLEKIAHILDVDPPYLIDQRYDNPHAYRENLIKEERKTFYGKYEHTLTMVHSMGFSVFLVRKDVVAIDHVTKDIHYAMDLKSWEYFDKKIKNHIEYELLNCTQIYALSKRQKESDREELI